MLLNKRGEPTETNAKYGRRTDAPISTPGRSNCCPLFFNCQSLTARPKVALHETRPGLARAGGERRGSRSAKKIYWPCAALQHRGSAFCHNVHAACFRFRVSQRGPRRVTKVECMNCWWPVGGTHPTYGVRQYI